MAQAGSVKWTGGAAASGTVTVTYPAPWQSTAVYYPLVFVTLTDYSGGNGAICVQTESIGQTTFDIHWYAADGATTYTSLDFHWMAVGPAVQW